jgi:phosphoribosylformimino-5-aminoimidazole carboxamide ribotide isomerase
MNQSFTIFPAIDLREGKVVRLMEGDPDRKTEYSSSPGDTARRWLDAGASWLHVINLDGAFGEDTRLNLQALDEIVMVVEPYGARIQFGGGLRSPETLDNAFQAGIERAILGTWVVQQPEILGKTLSRWGQERLAVSLDARGSEVQVRGWQEGTGLDLFHLAEQFASQGLRWLVYTDIGRDGMKTGFNSQTTIQLAQQSGLQVIASGGVRSSEDITRAKRSGLAGIILGRALYEGNINLAKAIEEYQSQ